MNFMKKSFKDKLGIILFIIGLIFLGIMTCVGFTKLGMWYDEIYSINMIKLPFSEMVSLSSKDVHPILYYCIYKFFFKISTLLNIPNMILVGKLVSLLPFYLIIILTATKVRKSFGWLTAGIFAICITSMPQLMHYGVELRMYSWGLFFITASFIYVYDIISRESNWKQWVILTILTICSAYTHYYSAIASFILYFALLIYFILKNKKELKKWLISAIVSVISFLPWVVILLSQIQKTDYYWIKPITLKTIVGYIWYVFSPNNQMINANQIATWSVLGILLLISVVILVISYLRRSEKDIIGKYAFMGILITVFVPLIGIIISVITHPFFHPRYMIPVLGCLWLGVSILLGKNYNKKEIFIPVLVIILLVGAVGTINFEKIQTQDENTDIAFTKTLKDTFGSGNIIIYDFFPVMLEMNNYYLIDNHHICLPLDNGLRHFNQSVLEIDKIIEDPGVKNEIQHGSKVYYMQSKNYDDNISLYNDKFTLKEIPIKLDIGATFYEVIIK